MRVEAAGDGAKLGLPLKSKTLDLLDAQSWWDPVFEEKSLTSSFVTEL